MYQPKIAKYRTNDNNLPFNIEEINKISWSSEFFKFTYKEYKYFIEYLSFPLTTIGFNIDEIILFLKKSKINKLNLDSLTKNNIIVHIHNDGWNFYYPEKYESMISSVQLEGEIISINEYWIKTIIE